MKTRFIRTSLTVLAFTCCWFNAYALKPNYALNSDGFIFPDYKDFSIQFSYYGALDTSYFSHNPLNVKGDTNVRELEAWQQINFGQYWNLSFSEKAFEDEKLDNAVLFYNRKYFQIGIGQASQNFGLNNTNDLSTLMFAEYNLPVYAISPPTTIGVFPSVNSNLWAFQVSVIGGRLAKRYSKHMPFGYTARYFIAPEHTPGHVVHLGFSYWFQTPDGLHTTDLGSIPESMTASQPSFVDTGTINNVKNYWAGDAELGYEKNSLTLMAEYLFTRVNRSNKPNLWFKGFYLAGGYFLTGETNQYYFPAGYFSKPKKINHKYGAVQLVARLSDLDLDSGDIHGGKELDATLGCNWYITTNTLVRFNFIHVWNQTPTDNKRKNFNIALLRIQTGLY